MYHEIDRKFLIEEMPSLRGFAPVLHERYFIQYGDLAEERIQKCNGVFEYEIKMMITPHERSRERKVLTEKEFEKLKKRSSKVILLESYLLSKKNPRLSINKYKGDYQGLVFAELEFDTREESEAYVPEEWMSTEITNTKLGRDSWLLELDKEHFLNILDTEQNEKNIEGFL